MTCANKTHRFRDLPNDVAAHHRAVDVLTALPAALVRWLKRRHTRQVLAALDQDQLHDIGLTRAELSKF